MNKLQVTLVSARLQLSPKPEDSVVECVFLQVEANQGHAFDVRLQDALVVFVPQESCRFKVGYNYTLSVSIV